MVVTMFQIIVEIPEASSLKDKRRVVHALRDRTLRKFKISCAEIDLQESLRFAQLGGAVVSNSKEHGEALMQKAVDFMEKLALAKLQDYQIHSELF